MKNLWLFNLFTYLAYLQLRVHFVISLESNYILRLPAQKMNMQTVQSSDFQILSSQSEIQCGLLCLRNDRCKVADYNNKKETCILFTIYDRQKLIPADDIVHLQLNQYCKSLHPKQGMIHDCTSLSFVLNDCRDYLREGYRTNGVYNIKTNVNSNKYVRVFCDMTTDGGGWIVFQKRFDGSVSFNNTWEDYESGFGDLYGEFWLGLKFIHGYTNNQETEMRVDLQDWNGNKVYRKYPSFYIGDRDSGYKLRLTGVGSGSLADSLSYTNNRPFSTLDKDFSNGCSATYNAKWWSGISPKCLAAHLNGQYFQNPSAPYAMGLWWYSSPGYGHYYSMKETQMSMR